MVYITPLSKLEHSSLPLAGGKGANLGALLQGGFPVPHGFCITTKAYQAFVDTNRLQEEILGVCQNLQADDPAALEAASTTIRGRFASGQLPLDIANEVRRAYTDLNRQSSIVNRQLIAVAVRSSATAEDLPDMSFAGQQDTYLNIIGEEALLQAVIDCWSSLWTARAIGYRTRNNIPQDDVALAVVVQQMVPSEASGVAFTANPLTGKRTETVIDATLGLGEALVSGQVEPDHYVVDDGQIIDKTLGAKAIAIHGQENGGTVTVNEDASTQQALPDEQILKLALLGKRIEKAFGTPQDIEWAWADRKMTIVQSRPITSLYPLPEGMNPEPPAALFSFGVWQGMLEPYTPAGQDVFDGIVAGVGTLFGAKIDPAQQRVMLTAGERLFVDVSGMLRNSVGQVVANTFVDAIDPASGSIIKKLAEDESFAVKGGISLKIGFRLLRGALPFFSNLFFYLLAPRRGRGRLQRVVADSHAHLQAQCAAAKDPAELADLIQIISIRQIRELFPILVTAVAGGQGMPMQMLLRMSADIPSGEELVMEMTRGLPYNVTTEMDLALWEMAKVIRADTDSMRRFEEANIDELVADYRADSLPAASQDAIERFLALYGLRGVGEIDMGRPRWYEDPTYILQVLKSYMRIDESAAPDVVFQRSVEKANQAQEKLLAALRAARGGAVRSLLARFMARRLRELGGLREVPKFAVIRRLGVMHEALLATGIQLVKEGILAEPEDVFFLHLVELKETMADREIDWKTLVAERQAVYERESRRRRVPRVLLSDGTAFYGGVSAASGDGAHVLRGSPVSPGAVEGVARVVLDPHGAQLNPGDILVCPATDPAWTPLFLAVDGLVMEVGGMMQHGAVVAREYGIPAVVGVDQATTRLQTGQRIRVDGGNGVVTILPPEAER